jgi:hypothetical protein
VTHKIERVLAVRELARVEGEGALYIRASGNRVEEAADLTQGTGLTPPVAAAVDIVASAILEDIAGLRAAGPLALSGERPSGHHGHERCPVHGGAHGRQTS